MNLPELEKIALSDIEIDHSVGQIPHKIIEYPKLKGYRNLEELMEGLRAVIVLLEIDDDRTKSGHWICILDRGPSYEYFDPYGMTPGQELSLTHEKPIILGILSRTNKKLIINQKRFQAFKHDVNTCGRWCICRVRHWKLDLKQFWTFIRRNPFGWQNDIYVTYLTRGSTGDRNAWMRQMSGQTGGILSTDHPLQTFVPTFS